MRGPMPAPRCRPGRSRPSRRPCVRGVPGGCAPGPSVPVSPPCGGRRPGLRRSRVPGRPRPGVRGRLAYRRGVPARRGGASSPPGAAAAASADPVPGGLSSPGPRSPGRLVVAAGVRAPGPPCGGRPRLPPPRPPRPVRPAPGPPRPPPVGPPADGVGGRRSSLPPGAVRRPAAAPVSLRARGGGVGAVACLGAAAALVGPAALLRGRWGPKPDGRVSGQGSRRAAAYGRP